jgi:glycosyltransferase involved in cell wall biosynthesis
MRAASVAVIHPGLGYGGSEAPVMWTLAALKGDYDLTLISTGELDLARLNAYYGTALDAQDFTYQRARLPLRLRNTVKFAALTGSFFQRFVRRMAPQFDVLINCYGPLDCGRRGIQMIADFSFVEEWRFSLNPSLRSWKRWWYGSSPLRRLYLALCARVYPFNPASWKQNVTLANSAWTAGRLQEKYGLESQVLYPPVESDFPLVPFEERDNGFVCLGRVVPEKRVDVMIEILSRVRQKGHDVHLRILGGLDDSPYGKQVKRLADQNRAWITLEGWAIGERKKHLLATHRYGIHGRENEPFGIAVGEMVSAGCIVFVPSGGGQVEIVDHPALIFNGENDAVEKIEAVLTSNAAQEELRHHLRQNAHKFSPESFQIKIRQVVKDFLAGHREP